MPIWRGFLLQEIIIALQSLQKIRAMLHTSRGWLIPQKERPAVYTIAMGATSRYMQVSRLSAREPDTMRKEGPGTLVVYRPWHLQECVCRANQIIVVKCRNHWPSSSLQGSIGAGPGIEGFRKTIGQLTLCRLTTPLMGKRYRCPIACVY